MSTCPQTPWCFYSSLSSLLVHPLFTATRWPWLRRWTRCSTARWVRPNVSVWLSLRLVLRPTSSSCRQASCQIQSEKRRGGHCRSACTTTLPASLLADDHPTRPSAPGLPSSSCPLQVREFEIKKVPVPSIGPDEVLIKGGPNSSRPDFSDLCSQHLRPLWNRCECLVYRSVAPG
jgi:hypothetical protein